MLITATLKRRDGRIMGTKSVPEECLALRWGGSTWVAQKTRARGLSAKVYVDTDTFHFDDLDERK